MVATCRPSAKQPTTGEHHHRSEELQKGRAVAIIMLTFISCLEVQLLWGDVASVASVGFTFCVLVLVFAGHFNRSSEPATHGGSCWLNGLISFLSLFLAVVLLAVQAGTNRGIL